MFKIVTCFLDFLNYSKESYELLWKDQEGILCFNQQKHFFYNSFYLPHIYVILDPIDYYYRKIFQVVCFKTFS